MTATIWGAIAHAAEAEAALGRLEADPERWLRTMFPDSFSAPLAPHHRQFWDWTETITTGAPSAFVGIWNRGGAKSTTAEAAVVRLGALQRRRYVLYVCGTQRQADDHVASGVGAKLMSPAIREHYPALSRRKVGPYGMPEGWRRNRLVTDAGLVVDALGLDAAARGAKLDDQRPDLIVIDDVDDASDSPAVTERKRRALTQGVLLAGAPNVAVVAIQNLVHPHSIFSDLAGPEPPFLGRRVLSGPIPAVEGLQTERTPEGWQIVAGEPTWEGMDLDACQHEINLSGIAAFLRECQHEVAVGGGIYWSPDDFRYVELEWGPTILAVDPAVTDKATSDRSAIAVVSLTTNKTRIGVRSARAGRWSSAQLRGAIAAMIEAYPEVSRVVVESNQGGDTWSELLGGLPVPVSTQTVSESKKLRAAKAHSLYTRGVVVHERQMPEVEAELCAFDTGPYDDLVDAIGLAVSRLARSAVSRSKPKARRSVYAS